MHDLNDLYFFVQVVDHRGFAPAARALGVQKSRLSRRIALLEDRLGARLIQRSSRKFSVTDIGWTYYHHCVAMLVEAEAAEAAVSQAHDEPRGLVRISCPTALLSFQFGALFAGFLTAYPEVDLRLEAVNRRVDVIAEGLDLAIRVRFPPLEPTELVMRRLDESSQCLVASPSLITAPLPGPADLAGLPSLDTGPARTDPGWRLAHEDGRTAVVPHRPRLVTDDMETLKQAALAGIGVAQLPTMMVWRDIEAGRLVHALPAWRPPSGVVHAVFPSRRGLLPSVRALLDYLADRCAEQRREAGATVDG
jgi:DNA-binding transcriptional LysR family regulator